MLATVGGELGPVVDVPTAITPVDAELAPAFLPMMTFRKSPVGGCRERCRGGRRGDAERKQRWARTRRKIMCP